MSFLARAAERSEATAQTLGLFLRSKSDADGGFHAAAYVQTAPPSRNGFALTSGS